MLYNEIIALCSEIHRTEGKVEINALYFYRNLIQFCWTLKFVTLKPREMAGQVSIKFTKHNKDPIKS